MNRHLKRLAQKANKVKTAVVTGATTVAISSANAAVTMPTADYTTIELAAGIGFAVILTVGLLMKAKRFFR